MKPSDFRNAETKHVVGDRRQVGTRGVRHGELVGNRLGRQR